jgi:hypothetical protein
VSAGSSAVVTNYVKDHSQNSNSSTSKTNSPSLSEVLNNAAAYKNKQLALEGYILQLGYEKPAAKLVKKYYLATAGNSPQAVLLDLSQTKVDPAKYAGTATTGDAAPPEGTPPPAKKMVTVTGKLVRDKPGETLHFVVKSIK